MPCASLCMPCRIDIAIPGTTVPPLLLICRTCYYSAVLVQYLCPYLFGTNASRAGAIRLDQTRMPAKQAPYSHNKFQPTVGLSEFPQQPAQWQSSPNQEVLREVASPIARQQHPSRQVPLLLQYAEASHSRQQHLFLQPGQLEPEFT